MKDHFVFKVRLLLLFIFVGIISFPANAQKLPKVQTLALRAPDYIKIDAKTTEWKNQFQAYNLNNRLYYTIANDDDNLYLIVRSSDEYSSEKALFGIKFTIKLPGENNGRPKESVAITFPKYSDMDHTEKIRNTINAVRNLREDTAKATQRKIDTLRLFANRLIGITHKEIIVEGIKTIADPVIAMYNTEGIKVAAQFDLQMNYTYELAIPLKYLGSIINDGKKFDYNIKMVAMPQVSPNGMRIPRVEEVSFGGEAPAGANYFSSNQGFVAIPTDLSGTYSLKKR
ncbi:MAG: hypothetical protein V4619_15105 [Bacteroidota bacterium]